MGQKTNPILNRLYINRMSSSKWCVASKKDYAENTKGDIILRNKIMSEYPAVDEVIVERTPSSAHVIIYCAKPGVIIGKKGADADVLKKRIQAILKTEVHVSINKLCFLSIIHASWACLKCGLPAIPSLM